MQQIITKDNPLTHESFMDFVSRALNVRFKAREHEDFVPWIFANYRFRYNTPFSFDGHEYLRGIYECKAKQIFVMKSSQMGISEWLLGNTFYYAAEFGINVFYAFPKAAQLGDFVRERVHKVVNYSPNIKALVKDLPPAERTDNVGMKRIGEGYVYFRGSQNPDQIASVAGDIVIWDELDKMIEGNISVIERRADHSEYKIGRGASTPTGLDRGIHTKFQEGTMREWFIRCPHCNTEQVPDFDDNLIMTHRGEVIFVCRKCGRPMDRLMIGGWVAQYPDRDVETFHINKLFSSRIELKKLYARHISAMEGRVSETEIQTHYNEDMGIPYTQKGTGLNDEIIDATRGTHQNQETLRKTTMGVDVGGVFHVCIAKQDGEIRNKIFREVRTWDELGELMVIHDVDICVIDNEPERTKASEFAARFRGRVYLGDERDNRIRGPKGEPFMLDRGRRFIKIDRTFLMDLVRMNYALRSCRIPIDARNIHGLYEHLKSPVREMDVDANGDVKYRYRSRRADHYYHADLFEQVAFMIRPRGTLELDLGQDYKSDITPKLIQKYYDVIMNLRFTLKREPQDHEIAAEMGIAMDDFEYYKEMITFSIYDDEVHENVPGMDHGVGIPEFIEEP